MDLVEAHADRPIAQARHPWERARCALVSRLIASQVTLRAGDTVLDVGCGDAFVLETLASRYPDVMFHGVDTALTAAQLQSIRATITQPNVSVAAGLDDRGSKRVALVLLMDVIEHVADDQALLREVCAAGHLDADARVLVTVPAYPQLFSAHDRFLGHYRRYTRASLRATLDAVNLRVVEEGQFFTTLVPPRLWQLLREKVVGPPAQHGVGAWSGGAALGDMMTRMLTLDGRLSIGLSRAGVPLPGLSVYAVCRPSV